MATHFGVSTAKASFLISMVGVTNTIGRVVTGGITELSFSSPLVVCTIATIIGITIQLLIKYTLHHSRCYFSCVDAYRRILSRNDGNIRCVWLCDQCPANNIYQDHCRSTWHQQPKLSRIHTGSFHWLFRSFHLCINTACSGLYSEMYCLLY